MELKNALIDLVEYVAVLFYKDSGIKKVTELSMIASLIVNRRQGTEETIKKHNRLLSFSAEKHDAGSLMQNMFLLFYDGLVNRAYYKHRNLNHQKRNLDYPLHEKRLGNTLWVND